MTAVSERPGVQVGAPAAAGGPLTGTGTLIKFILRRDRIRIPAWILVITFSLLSVARGLQQAYATAADRQARVEVMDSPVGRAVGGPGIGLDDYTIGAMLSNEFLSFIAIFVALMSVLLFVRHTRAEEETGRAELVRAAVVGRYAVTTAALVVVTVTNLVLGLLVALALASTGEESITVQGSLMYGASLASIGLVFTGIVAVCAQITEYGRSANGIAGALIAVVFVVRAVGDMGGNFLSWLSPIGWAQATRPYVDDRWWPLLVSALVTAVLVAAAFVLSTRRDVGAGLVPPRPGPRQASPLLGTPVGLALRMHRASLLWWGLGLFALGAAYGAFTGEVETFLQDNETFRDIFLQTEGTSFINSWLSSITSPLLAVASFYPVLAIQRMRAEETVGRVEPLLATGLSRARWLGSQVLVVLAGGVIMAVACGLGVGLTSALSAGDGSLMADGLVAALAYLPATWFVVGVAVALLGILPRALGAVWLVVVYGLFMEMTGGLIELPGWVTDLSPFEHIPALPATEFNALPLVLLTVISAGLIALGFVGMRKRDLESN
ncbi:ABC transporter permease [Actinomadura alba]|uniref:ABC transporter permease n=1 Tax=Actinomadura alba TaxID=406431 RepID=A0ABR7LVG9_9ACTN|nr:ABC transporter permease [Actinomadura alba]MBC6468418.1 ABC transporter permease [Actinomadura alba]